MNRLERLGLRRPPRRLGWNQTRCLGVDVFERCSSADRTSNGVELNGGLRLIELAIPVRRHRPGPASKRRGRRIRCRRATRPGPRARTRDEPGSYRIRLDVSEHGEQVLVRQDRHAFEPALIDVAGRVTSVRPPPSQAVRTRDPLHVGRKRFELVRHRDEVPMVRQEAVGEEADVRGPRCGSHHPKNDL